MPLFDEDGKEMENALTAEEVEEKLNEAKETAKSEAEEEANKSLEETQKESDREIEDLQTKLEETSELLEKEKEKDKNFGNLRKSKGVSDEKIKELTETVEGLKTSIDEKVNGIKDDTRKKELDAAIKSVAGNDKDLADKIQFHYNKLSGEEYFVLRVQSAVSLATGGKSASVLDGVISGSGGNPPPSEEGEKGELSADAKDVSKKLGISDADIEKAKKNNII